MMILEKKTEQILYTSYFIIFGVLSVNSVRKVVVFARELTLTRTHDDEMMGTPRRDEIIWRMLRDKAEEISQMSASLLSIFFFPSPSCHLPRSIRDDKKSTSETMMESRSQFFFLYLSVAYR